jgi:hypothetical protein
MKLGISIIEISISMLLCPQIVLKRDSFHHVNCRLHHRNYDLHNGNLDLHEGVYELHHEN